MHDLPDEVRSFVRQHIPSMDHLEVLMRLHGEQQRACSFEELQQYTHLDERTLARCLDSLQRSELVREAQGSFHYRPRTVALRQDVDAVSEMYHQRPVTLVKLVYEQPSGPPLSL